MASLKHSESIYEPITGHLLRGKAGRKTRERARREFVSAVGRDMSDTDRDFEGIFEEFLLFDYPYRNGKSLLEHYLDYHPADVDADLLDMLAQMSASQFCGFFWISGVAPESAMLIDTLTREQYELDALPANQPLPAPAGLLGARIANVNGSWIFAGRLAYFLPAAGGMPTTGVTLASGGGTGGRSSPTLSGSATASGRKTRAASSPWEAPP